MRLMLWSLLALNGVLAALWLAGVTVPATSRPAAAPPALTAKRLELLSELPFAPPRLGAEVDIQASRSTDTPSPESGPAGVESAAPAVPTAEAPGSMAAPPAVAIVPTGHDAVSPTAPAAPQSRAVSGTEYVAHQAASEPIEPATPAGAQVAVGTPGAPTDKSSAVTEMADVVACFRTAEFAPDARERVGAVLQQAGLAPAELKSSVRPRYWVYWSGASGAAAGVEQALKTAAVRDWYRVGGAHEATISLGVYGQADGARRRQRELAAKGIQATVGERYVASARLHWQFKARASAVESARATLEGAGVRLEACP